MSRMSEMCNAMHDYCEENFSPEDERGTPMQRLLDAAGWDAGSTRHKQLQAALDGARLKIVASWECMGRKQSLPDPGECNWPDCGCDPSATKVIENLIEQGWSAPTPLTSG